MGNLQSSALDGDQIRKVPVPVPVPVHSSAARIQRQSVNYRSVPENDICEICIEPMLSPNNLFNNGGKCIHPICTECVIKYIRNKLEDNVAGIRCPDFECIEFLDPLNCRRLIGPELFVRWCDALCERALTGVEKSYCPNRNCSALIVNECGEIAKRVVCPNCKRPFCFQCKIPWHHNFTCIEVGGGRGRRFDWDDRAFVELANQMEWKSCPQCYHFVELTYGCIIVQCRCGALFCYVCGKHADFRTHWCRTCRVTSPLRDSGSELKFLYIPIVVAFLITGYLLF